jgi:hypothetical protein
MPRYFAAAMFGLFLPVAAALLAIAAWFTHVIVCFKTASWGFLVAGAVFFPVGVIHGWLIWLGIV